MAELKVPIHVNLPDDWLEQIVDRLRNDPEAEWAEVIRCKDCLMHGVCRFEQFLGLSGFCSKAERREEGDE